MSVSEEKPNVFFYYPEEDHVLGQHETSLNGTNTDRKFAISLQIVFAFAI